MNLADVMDEVADQLGAIGGLRAYPYPVSTISPPAAIVSYPETYTYDETYGRGMDRLTLPVVVLVSLASDRAARDQLGQYVDGAGAKSVKQAVESGTYEAFDTARVQSVVFDAVTISAVEYLAATFSIDIAGEGAP